MMPHFENATKASWVEDGQSTPYMTDYAPVVPKNAENDVFLIERVCVCFSSFFIAPKGYQVAKMYKKHYSKRNFRVS